jgi:hypothetical protein
MLVSAFEAAEIGALSGPRASDKEGHVRGLWQWRGRWLCRLLLCFDNGCHAEHSEGHGEHGCRRGSGRK